MAQRNYRNNEDAARMQAMRKKANDTMNMMSQGAESKPVQPKMESHVMQRIKANAAKFQPGGSRYQGPTISQPGDDQEKEADAIAAQVVKGEGKGEGEGKVQRKHEESLMTKREGEELEGTDEMQEQLNSSKGGGQALDDKTKTEMEGKLGADLGDVRIHTGAKASGMSEGINAKAFTHGQDIYFKDGNYDPQGKEGKELLAHELVHTVQQGKGAGRMVSRTIEISKEGGKDDEYETFTPTPEFTESFNAELINAGYNAPKGLELLQIMSENEGTFRYKQLDHLKKEIKFRLQHLSVMENDIKSLGGEGFGGPATNASEYWEISTTGIGYGFTLKKINGSDENVNPSSAVDALIAPSNKLKVDCSTALAVAEVVAVRRELGTEAFNLLYRNKPLLIQPLKIQDARKTKNFSDANLAELTAKVPADQKRITALDQLIPGDRGHFINFEMRGDPYAAEFVMYMGKNESGEHLFRGHPYGDAMTYRELQTKLEKEYDRYLSSNPHLEDERKYVPTSKQAKIYGNFDYGVIDNIRPGLYKIIERPNVVQLYGLK